MTRDPQVCEGGQKIPVAKAGHEGTPRGRSGSHSHAQQYKRNTGVIVQKESLTALVRHHLETALAASSGRSGHTIYGGHERLLRQA